MLDECQQETSGYQSINLDSGVSRSYTPLMVDEPQRRLTTIVAADIAGFSRLVGVDEEGTLAAQRGHRTELIEPLLAQHNGRITNTAGDSFLLEFPSVVDAVRCSIAVQEGMVERNHDISADRRIRFALASTSAMSSQTVMIYWVMALTLPLAWKT
jgi:class 3 adenylate cyclase